MAKKEKEEIEIEVEPEKKEAEAPQIIGITIDAARLLVEIINTCAKRGAFTPEEFAVVGTLYNQLKTNLPAAPAPAEKEETTEEQAELPLGD